MYKMKVWASNEVRAKSKFWCALCMGRTYGGCSLLGGSSDSLSTFYQLCRYFLRKLKKVKRNNGEVLSVNEVRELEPLPIVRLG